MVELPFDLEHPPDDPPPGAAQPMLWRVAIRLHHDHGTAVTGRAGPPTCAQCDQPWPCDGRRLARRGLVAAYRPPPDQDSSAGYVDRFLSGPIMDA